jgi:tetratricopeptide (TPR) repeat protein
MDLSKHLEKAAEAVKRRNYPFAVNLYGQLLALQPDNGQARSGLRTALFKKAEAKKPSKVFALIGGGVHLLIGKACRMLGRHAAAARSFERYLAHDPLSESVNLQLGDSLERAGFGDSALAVYRSYAEHEPRCLEASKRAGQLLYERNDHRAALAMFEQALKVDPRDQDSLRARKNLAAEGALRSSGLETATHSRELAKDKDAQRKLEKSSRLQLSREEIEAEIEELEAQVAESPEARGAFVRLGDLHDMRRDPQSALDCYEQALRLAPNDSDIAAKVGDLRLRIQEQRVHEAEQRGDQNAAKLARRALDEARVGEFKRRVEQHPTDLLARYELGAALLATGAVDAAIAELQQSIKDPRKKAESLLLLGRAFLGKGLGELAGAQLDKALEAAGGPAGKLGKDVLYELGVAAERGGRSEDAIRHYSRILELDIGFRDVAKKVEQLKAAP